MRAARAAGRISELPQHLFGAPLNQCGQRIGGLVFGLVWFDLDTSRSSGDWSLHCKRSLCQCRDRCARRARSIPGPRGLVWIVVALSGILSRLAEFDRVRDRVVPHRAQLVSATSIAGVGGARQRAIADYARISSNSATNFKRWCSAVFLCTLKQDKCAAMSRGHGKIQAMLAAMVYANAGPTDQSAMIRRTASGARFFD